MTHKIKKQLLSGVFYTALAKYSGIVISLVISAILARLISPDDFGIVAIATVLIAFFNLFTDIGISPAIVQHKELSKKDLSNIFMFTFWIGLLLSILFFFSAWFIAAYYVLGILLFICQLFSMNIHFASFNIVPNALFYRNKEYKLLALRSFQIQVIFGVLSIFPALTKAKFYPILITPVLSSIIIFIV